MVKHNLQAQMKKDPSLVQAVYRVGTSNLEFTMNQNNLYAVRDQWKETGNSYRRRYEYVYPKSVLGRIPAYFNVDTVFDVKDTTIPEYLYVHKEKCTKDEMVKDKKGKSDKKQSWTVQNCQYTGKTGEIPSRPRYVRAGKRPGKNDTPV